MGSTIAESLKIAQVIEKLGIVGVLVLVCALFAVAAYYFRKEAIRLHAIIDTKNDDVYRLRQMFLIIKLEADRAGLHYDLREVGDLDDLLRRSAKP